MRTDGGAEFSDLRSRSVMILVQFALPVTVAIYTVVLARLDVLLLLSLFPLIIQPNNSCSSVLKFDGESLFEKHLRLGSMLYIA